MTKQIMNQHQETNLPHYRQLADGNYGFFRDGLLIFQADSLGFILDTFSGNVVMHGPASLVHMRMSQLEEACQKLGDFSDIRNLEVYEVCPTQQDAPTLLADPDALSRHFSQARASAAAFARDVIQAHRLKH